MFLGLLASLLASSTLSGAFPARKLAPSILTIGDSTVTSTAGWGAGFCADTRGLANCTNLAVSGTTTVSWKHHWTEYQAMLDGCKTPETWATIQFGHNDQKVMNTSEFALNLENLTLTIQEAGCKPILVTSLARRVYASEYVLTDILGPYSNETINVAAKLKLPLLPLLNDSLTYLTKLGKTQSIYFNYGSAINGTDRTHLNELGWKYFGRMVADEVHKYVPQLRHYIAPDRALSAALANGTILPEDIPVAETTSA